MLEPHGSPMKWPGTGAEEEAGEAGLQSARSSQARTQDDAAVHYVFQREPQEAELPSLASKQRWAVVDDAIAEVSYSSIVCRAFLIINKYSTGEHNLKVITFNRNVCYLCIL